MSTEEQYELELKKWEEWYSLTKEALKNTEKRFEKIEEKMSRYSVLVTFIIGIMALKIVDFVRYWQAADSCTEYYFVISFISLGSAAFIALFLYIISLEFETFYGAPITPEGLEVFKENNYVSAIFAMSESNLEAINNNKKIITAKLFIAHMAYRFTLASIILTAATVFTYTLSYVTG